MVKGPGTKANIASDASHDAETVNEHAVIAETVTTEAVSGEIPWQQKWSS